MQCFLPFSALLNPLDTKTVEQMLQITNVWEPMFAVKILLRWTPKQTTLAFPVPRSQEENSNIPNVVLFPESDKPDFITLSFY